MHEPIDLATEDHRQLTSKATGEPYSLSSVLSDRLGLDALFVHHDIVPPGRAMSAPHTHSHREEMVVVLSGEVIALTDSGTTVLPTGTVMGFPAGVRHQVRNDSDREARVLVVASNPSNDRVDYARA